MSSIETRRMFYSWTHTGILTGPTSDPVGYYPAEDGCAPSIVADITVHHRASEEEIAQAVVDAHGEFVPGCPCRPRARA